MALNYEISTEGLRLVKTDKVEYRIRLDRNTSLWSIETDTGQTPVSLRGNYTSARLAAIDIQVYLDAAPARQEIYKKKV